MVTHNGEKKETVLMSAFLDRIIDRAKAERKTIVLPEGDDERTIEAARKARDLDIANIIVLSHAPKDSISDFDGITVIDPANAADNEELANVLFELRRKKGMTREEAYELVQDELYHGVMMVYTGEADGMVSGAAHATSDVLRPSLQILKTKPGTSLVSAFFVIVVPDCEYGRGFGNGAGEDEAGRDDKRDGAFIFADSGLVQYPDKDELADIAIASAASFRQLLEDEPVVAMLSHSTKGSAKGESIDKVVAATKIAHEKAPDLALDGEFQLDAAIVPSVGASKAPGSDVAGHANVLVFPDLDSGNIGYKLAQRLAKAEAYGPITQGIAKPVNDLSRGATAADIVGVIAITAVQCQEAQ
jgi:phosphate acetyltransferase